MLQILPKTFYERSPDNVARYLLGKSLVRKFEGKIIDSMIVETEAYFGERDPASRAFNGKKRYNLMMWDEPGRLFIYNVHKYWMMNVIAHEPGNVGGVLIRALEPKTGIDIMRTLRKTNDDRELASGPGKLSIALGITPDLNGCPVTDLNSPVLIYDAPVIMDYCTSHRIGVTKDLMEELRFYVKNNKFVSK